MFKLGDTVRIKSGPFGNFIGLVQKVDVANSIVITRVEIFGREVAVEVAISEAERVPPEYRLKTPPGGLN
jgi:transcriptional antiterminator NusG